MAAYCRILVPFPLNETRETRLVSRVPKVPFYFLVALNLVYVILGIVLASVALLSKPSDSNDVRERMSIVELVAFAFEGERARKAVEKKRQRKEFPGSEWKGQCRVAGSTQ